MGAGYDTVRYWEIPANHMMLMSEKLNSVIENDFIDGENAVFFSSIDEFNDKYNYYIKYPDKTDDIAKNGHTWFLKYHTSTKRAEQLLEKINENIPKHRN